MGKTPPKKPRTATRYQKREFAPENGFQKPTLRRGERREDTRKTTSNTQKQKKNAQHFPLWYLVLGVEYCIHNIFRLGNYTHTHPHLHTHTPDRKRERERTKKEEERERDLGKNVLVRAQEATRQGPPPEQNGSWHYVPGVPVAQNQTLETKQCRTRRGPTLRPQGAPPSPHSGKGACEITRFSPLRRKTKTKGEKQKPRTRNQETPMPPRVQKGASEGASELKPREFQENPKTRGGQNGTLKKRQEAGRTAKTGDKPSAAGQKENRNKQNKCVWGCPVTT